MLIAEFLSAERYARITIWNIMKILSVRNSCKRMWSYWGEAFRVGASCAREYWSSGHTSWHIVILQELTTTNIEEYSLICTIPSILCE